MNPSLHSVLIYTKAVVETVSPGSSTMGAIAIAFEDQQRFGKPISEPIDSSMGPLTETRAAYVVSEQGAPARTRC